MNSTKKLLLFLVLFTARLQAMDQALMHPQANDLTMIDTAQDPIALNIIKAMQECIEFNNITQLNLDANGIAQQHTAWQDAVKLYHKYINDLRKKHKNLTRPELTTLPKINDDADLQTKLSLQSNQAQFFFTCLLDEYLTHLGHAYEKKSGILGLYKTSYYISSKTNQSLAITPHEYNLLIQTLDNAAKQSDWGKTINLKLLITQENPSIITKSLTLNEIINAIKQVPLPVQYSTAAKIGMGVVAAAAIGAGVYYVATGSDSQLPPQAIQITKSPTTKKETQSFAAKHLTSGLQRYMNDVASNPDFDDQIASNTYVTPDELEKGLTSPIAETLHLPIDIKNRSQIAWKNLNDPSYKIGYSMEKYVDRAEIDPDNLEAYITPDQGDYSLQHTATAVATTATFTPPYAKTSLLIAPVMASSLTAIPLSQDITTGAIIGASLTAIAGSKIGPLTKRTAEAIAKGNAAIKANAGKTGPMTKEASQILAEENITRHAGPITKETAKLIVDGQFTGHIGKAGMVGATLGGAVGGIAGLE
jgi:hypothetical protein